MIEDDYFKATDPDRARQRLDRRHGRALRKGRRQVSHYFDPASSQFEASTSGNFSGRRDHRHRGQARTAGRQRASGHTGRGCRHPSRGRDRGRRRAIDRGRICRCLRRPRSRGRRDSVELTGPPMAASGATSTVERADVACRPSRGRMEARRRRKVAYVALPPSARGPRRARDEVERLDRQGRQGPGPRPARQRRRAVNEAVLSPSIFLDHGNRGLDRQPHPGDQDYDATGDTLPSARPPS